MNTERLTRLLSTDRLIAAAAAAPDSRLRHYVTHFSRLSLSSTPITHNHNKTCKFLQAATCNKHEHNCNKTYKLQGNWQRHVPCLPIRGAFSQQADDTIDWTVRCDWLQVESSCIILDTHNIMLMRSAKTCASVAGLVASFVVVVMRDLFTACIMVCNFPMRQHTHCVITFIIF